MYKILGTVEYDYDTEYYKKAIYNNMFRRWQAVAAHLLLPLPSLSPPILASQH
jgi:hypothetical protein